MKRTPVGVLFLQSRFLFDGDFGAADGAAGEGTDLARGHLDDAVAGGMDGVVAAEQRTFARSLGHADLADDDLALFDLLAAK